VPFDRVRTAGAPSKVIKLSGVRAVPSLRYQQNVPPFNEHYFDEAVDESIDQGPTGGLGKVRFHDWRPPFDHFAYLPNVDLLRKQIDVLAEMLASATPDATQQKDIDFAFGVGQLFAVVPYAQLILEEALL